MNLSTTLPPSQTRSRRGLVYSSFGPPLSTLELVDTQTPALPAGHVRVAMLLSPINPSDLIPVTGAYAQRIVLPAIAGYEGVGRVIEASPEFAPMVGKRVLPLRGEGTWQTVADCQGIHAIEVPDAIPDMIAARAYINPLAAFTMLRLWPVRDRAVLLCGAGSTCADFLGHWAVRQGARKVIGIYRSENRVPRLRALGIEPVSQHDWARISASARTVDLTFDALGGPLASSILRLMQVESTFVSYGLLTGRSIKIARTPTASYRRFHLRDHLEKADRDGMASTFSNIWPLLTEMALPTSSVFPIGKWREAILEAEKPGGRKPLLDLSVK